MSHIFISYRRTDSAEMSRRIYHELIKHINRKKVFRDVDTLMKGHDFRAGIESFIFRSDVMLVLIGEDWLTTRDTETGEYRLHNPEDFVRIEVDMGLRHIKTIIPVLVNGASMPTETELPRRLSGLAFKNAVNVCDDRFDEDFQVLLQAIGIRRSYFKWVLGLIGLIAVIALGFMALNSVNRPDPTPTAESDIPQIALNTTDEPLSTPDISPDDARATGVVQAYQTLTALAPTDTPTITPTPTDTPISSSDIQLTARAEVFATETSVSQTQAVIAQVTQNAVLTEQFNAGATLTESFQLSLTPLLTNTPTATQTPTKSSTMDIPEVALTPVSRNRDWTPIERDFDGVPMVLVPVGCFMMGENGAGGEQCFDAPFWIDKTEVTQANFTRLNGVKEYDNYFLGDNRPVENITWFEAQAFCELRGGRLPTEAEWEYGAGGVESWVYPWGNDWDANKAVWNRSFEQGTADVGSIPTGASWVGALDMAGNVWEWTSTLYTTYPYDADDGREDISTSGLRVLRGGSWAVIDSDVLRVANRFGGDPDDWLVILGFRCVLYP